MLQRFLADTSFEQNVTLDANGNSLTYRTRSGNTIVRTFNELNWVTSKLPQKQAKVSYVYDLAGRLLKASTPVVAGDPGSGELKFYFDTAGRHFKEEYPDGKIVEHQLDPNGNVIRTTWPDGYFVEKLWDALNRLTDIKLNGAGTPAAHINYDPLSRRTSMSMENGVVTTYSHELDNDLSTLAHSFTGSNVTFTYGYNNVRQMTSQQVSDAQYLWHPSAGGSTTYGVATSVNQYPSVGGQNLTYDGNRNLTFDGVNQYSFDTENHLLTANWILGTTLWRYRYDSAGRQAQKEVSPNKTRFIYSGWQRLADYDGVSGALQSRYVYGDTLDDIVIKVDPLGTKTYYSKNHQGSVVALSDSTGTVLSRFKYGPFGESSTLIGTSHGFTGQRFDAETSSYYYKNRQFLPRLGRFLQNDFVNDAVGADLNLYTYTENDPLNFTDPMGLIAASGKPGEFVQKAKDFFSNVFGGGGGGEDPPRRPKTKQKNADDPNDPSSPPVPALAKGPCIDALKQDYKNDEQETRKFFKKLCGKNYRKNLKYKQAMRDLNASFRERMRDCFKDGGLSADDVIQQANQAADEAITKAIEAGLNN